MRRLATLVTALALAVLSAAPAPAATYYVRPGGSNGAAGTSYAAAWATIAKANTTIAAGDVVYVYPGSYADFPNPTAAGADESNRFTFIGAHPTLDPTADSLARRSVLLPGGTLSKPFVTLNGFRIAGPLSLGAAARKDTLSYLQVTGSLDLGDADYCILDRCTFDGATFYVGATSGQHAIGDELHGCNFWRLGSGYGGSANVVQLGSTASAAVTSSADSLVLRFNRFDITLTANGDPASHAIVAYAMRDCAWRGNLIGVHNRHASGRWGALILSDSTSRNAFDRDSLNADGDGTSQAQLSSITELTAKTVGRNTLDSCWFKVTDCPARFAAGINHDILTYSTFVGGGAGLTATRSLGRNFIDHCTFAAGAVGAGVVSLASGSPGWADVTVFTNNILYAFDNPTNDCVGASNYRSALFVPVRSIDSTFYGGGSHSTHWRSEGNLYSYFGHSQTCPTVADSAGQRSVVFTTATADYGNLPGTSSPWTVSWCIGADDSSKYGTPAFRDSSRATFDPTLGLNSKAISNALGGSDIGAVAFVAQVRVALGPPAYFNNFGGVQTRDLVIQNLGTAVLSVTHITPAHASAAASQDTLSVGANATGIVTVTFTPNTAANNGIPSIINVSITSNDPVKPTALWPCYVNTSGGDVAPPPPLGEVRH